MSFLKTRFLQSFFFAVLYISCPFLHGSKIAKAIPGLTCRPNNVEVFLPIFFFFSKPMKNIFP